VAQISNRENLDPEVTESRLPNPKIVIIAKSRYSVLGKNRSKAEARADYQDGGAVDSEDCAARALRGNGDYGPYTRLWDLFWAASRTNRDRELRRRLGVETRCATLT